VFITPDYCLKGLRFESRRGDRLSSLGFFRQMLEYRTVGHARVLPHPFQIFFLLTLLFCNHCSQQSVF